MTVSKRRVLGILLVAAIAGGIGYGSWLGWRRYAAPQPPTVVLDRVHPEVAEAVEAGVAAVRLEPYSGKAWGELSCLLIANGFYEPALLCLVEVKKFEPNQPIWPYLSGSVSLVISRPRQALPELRAALAKSDKIEDRTAVLYLLAQTSLEVGQLDEADSYIRALRELDRGNPRLDLVLGLQAFARDDRDTARRHLTRILDHPCARKQVSSLLAILARTDEKLAQSYLQQATQSPADIPWPTSFDNRVGRYKINPTTGLEKFQDLQSAGQREEALDYLRQLAESSPDEQICFAFGLELFRIGAFDQAEPRFRQTLSLNPNHARAQTLLGAAILARAEKRREEVEGADEARELFREVVHAEERASQLQNESALPYHLKGRALRRLGRSGEAEIAFRKAILLGPNLYESHQALGEMLAEEGRIPEALLHLENAVRVAPVQIPGPRQALEMWKAKAKPSP